MQVCLHLPWAAASLKQQCGREIAVCPCGMSSSPAKAFPGKSVFEARLQPDRPNLPCQGPSDGTTGQASHLRLIEWASILRCGGMSICFGSTRAATSSAATTRRMTDPSAATFLNVSILCQVMPVLTELYTLMSMMPRARPCVVCSLFHVAARPRTRLSSVAPVLNLKSCAPVEQAKTEC